MSEKEEHLILPDTPIRDALERLNALGLQTTLFVTTEDQELLGAVTDGDVRRGLLKGSDLDSDVSEIMNREPYAFDKGVIENEMVRTLRRKGVALVPMVDDSRIIQEIIDLTHLKPKLPLDAVLMAGGRGSRLKPLTDDIPKPLLKVGEKPIIEHTLDHLTEHGIEKFHVSINYKKEMIREHLSKGAHCEKISFLEGDQPLGTAGSLSMVNEEGNEAILLMNSDLLTDLDIEDLYGRFEESQADIAIATSDYQIQIPYAVLQVEDGLVKEFKEKPTQTFATNAGIYLIRRSLLKMVPSDEEYNATDLLEDVIKSGGKVIAYPISGYWMDIGRHDDLKKARDLATKQSAE